MTDAPLIMGSLVTYHGSLHEAHGRRFLLLPCRCDEQPGAVDGEDDCFDARDDGFRRYALAALDDGQDVVHVRPGSFTVDEGAWWPKDSVLVRWNGERWRGSHTGHGEERALAPGRRILYVHHAGGAVWSFWAFLDPASDAYGALEARNPRSGRASSGGPPAGAAPGC